MADTGPSSRTGAGALSRLLPFLPTAGLLIGVLALWQLAVWSWRVPSYLLPGPMAVAIRLFSDPLLFGREGLVTLLEALGGLLIGGVLAMGAGLLMARWRWLER